MQVDVRTCIVASDPNSTVWLLRRSPSKKLLPGLITGIGGKVELTEGGADDLVAAANREWREEVPQLDGLLNNVRLRLVTHDTRGEVIFILLWFTAELSTVPTDMTCSEGELVSVKRNELPVDKMTPAARHAIPFVLRLQPDDNSVHDGVFSPDMKRLILNC